ncbi:hypothetical protein A6R68_10375 [Neotoma lepida]|uniref:Immunoglobulin subtype 2 domain-containing protein n=1 Tax=Neotoma lepida TaxID=56216 RepID=A0A1A6FY73_NEOLE|nr:hypothetical protein A6R68_10375 [Neotoma lepida]
MEQGKGLTGLILAIFLLQGTVAQPKQENRLVKVNDNRGDGSVLLTCDLKDKTITWLKDGSRISPPNVTEHSWNIGSSTKDPRGMYWCEGENGKSKPLQVYYRSTPSRIGMTTNTAISKEINQGKSELNMTQSVVPSIQYPGSKQCVSERAQ